MKNNYGVWDLERFKVSEPNKYENIIDEGIRFDYRSRECAIAEVFKTTTNPEVRQVLRFAMELQNQYRSEAMNLYNTLSKLNDQLELLSRLTQNILIDVYL